jgi:predicted regulator of Ras-like GTPase activity (Roadblock/LC7/MglB family)
LKQQKTIDPLQLIEGTPIITLGEDNAVFASLSATLAEIRKLKGVLGYILRSNTTAIIDLSNADIIPEYAMLSAQVFDCSGGIAKQFGLIDVESVLVEGKKVKLLCMRIGENRISVFMDKTCAHAWIVKRILL